MSNENEVLDPFEAGHDSAGADVLTPAQQAKANGLAMKEIRHRLTDKSLSDLDRLALIRAAVWIAHSDGYGAGVTYAECKGLRDSRAAAEIPATARSIILRLSETMDPPDADGLAVARSDALSGIIPDDRP